MKIYVFFQKYVLFLGVCINMAKITISVPDELYEKMKEWKSSLNFSQVFQNAISGMIQKKEALTSKIRNEIDFSSVVDRLKKEKVEFELNIEPLPPAGALIGALENENQRQRERDRSSQGYACRPGKANTLCHKPGNQRRGQGHRG